MFINFIFLFSIKMSKKFVDIKHLEKILNNMYILEYFDEENMNECPVNAKYSTIQMIQDNLPEWIDFTSLVKDENNIEYDVWEYIADCFSDTQCLCLDWDWEYLSPTI